ncbi:MFS transporter [Sporolactobacillus laevolacticus]|uniref:Permease n=1 Tax=Sporolactobacillus laevolacticus DSM 442 TaxID=1395513 RepID=V6J0C4_9BACL|nr:MFS transporter [Sporolactobacillus laevolacticus]EST12611.1 permease [Sporolactobacillus laevolacticus DSM 442]
MTIASYNIRLLFWSDFFGTMNFLQPVLTLFYLQRGLNAQDIFIVLFCWSAAVLVGEIPTGVYADRFGPKCSFITGAIFRIASIALLIFASEPWMFFLYSFINGFSATFYSGADEAFIYESLKESHQENQMDRAMGKIQSGSFIAMIVSVLFGAYVAKDLTTSQFDLLIMLTIIFQIAELVLTLFLRKPKRSAEPFENPFRQIKEGFLVIRRKPLLLLMFLNVTLVFIPVGAVFKNFDQPFLTHAGVPVSAIGFFYAGAAVLGFFASRSIGWLSSHYSRIALMFVTGALSVAGLVLAAYAGSGLWLAIGVFILLRIVQVIRYPIYSQISNDYIPSSVRATTISLLSIVDSCCDLAVFLTLSFVAAGNSMHPIFLGAAGIALVGMLLPIRPLNE